MIGVLFLLSVLARTAVLIVRRKTTILEHCQFCKILYDCMPPAMSGLGF